MSTPAPAEFQLLDDDLTSQLFGLDANELGRLPGDLENLASYLAEYVKVTIEILELANTTEGSVRVSVVDVLARPMFIATDVPFAVRLGTTTSVYDAWEWEGKGLAIVPELRAIVVKEQGTDRWVVVSAKQLFWHLRDTCRNNAITALNDQLIGWLSGVADTVDPTRHSEDTTTQPIDIVDVPAEQVEQVAVPA